MEETTMLAKIVAEVPQIIGTISTVATEVFSIEVVQIMLGVSLVGIAISLLGGIVGRFKSL